MSDVERMTISLTAEVAAAVKSAVACGDYASNSEIVREALRDWQHKRALQQHELDALNAGIQTGLADVAAGRVQEFSVERIVEKGRQRSASVEPSG